MLKSFVLRIVLIAFVSRCVKEVSRCVKEVSRCVKEVSRCVKEVSRCVKEVSRCVKEAESTEVNAMCAVALRMDCANHYLQQTDETVCATNGRTYANLCFFSKDKCSSPDLNIRHFGTCKTTPTTLSTSTTTSTTTTTATTITFSISPSPTPTTSATPTATTGATTTTLAVSTTTVDQSDILRRVFCAPESHVRCELFAPSPYCGSDYKVYDNECEFVKAQCTADIQAVDMSYCMQSLGDIHHHDHHHSHHTHHSHGT